MEKLEFFAKHKDEFDTLFLGSSRFYYAILARRFSIRRSRARTASRPAAFNFGIDGMHPPENFYVLEQILKTRAAKA